MTPTDAPSTSPHELPTEELHAYLMAEWERALPNQEAMGEALVARYSEPHRTYHNTTHLASVLRHVEELADDHDLFPVRLAAWFHDPVSPAPRQRGGGVP